MKKLFLLHILCLGFFVQLCSQQLIPVDEKKYNDSLVQLLQTSADDSIKANADFLLVALWRSRDTAKSRKYLDESFRLSQKYPYMKALYSFYEGEHYFNIDTAKAAAAFSKAVTELSKFNTKAAYISTAAAWFDYGIMNRNAKGDAFLIDIVLNKTIPIVQKSGEPEKLAHYYSQLATLFMYNAQFDKAEQYNNEAIKLLEEKYSQSAALLLTYLSASSNYLNQNKTAQAKVVIDKAYRILAPHPESVNYPFYYYNEGVYYMFIKKTDSAIASLDKGIEGATRLKQGALLQMLLFAKHNMYMEKRDFVAARTNLLKISTERIIMDDVNSRKTILQELWKVNDSLGNTTEAYKWATLYSKLSDSLNSSQMKVKMNEMETRFRTLEKEKEIGILKAEKSRSKLTLKNNRLYNWLLAAGCLVLLIIAGSLLVFYKNTRKLAKQKEINYQQQLKDVEQRQQLHLTQAMLEGEERERHRVARDLHDGLGGMLAGIKIKLSGQSNMQNPLNLDGVIQQLDNSVTELRRIARNMMPESLLRTGLETALQDLCESLMSPKTTIELQAYGIKKDIPAVTQANIYRIVQEILSNAIRHAEASKIVVQCSQNNNVFLITVEDNGKGFDTALIGQSKGIGFSNIKSRVEYLNGKMDISSEINEGTTFNIELNLGA